MRLNYIAYLVIGTLIVSCYHAEAKYARGALKTSRKWSFVEKFCFDESGMSSCVLHKEIEVLTQARYAGGELTVDITNLNNATRTMIGNSFAQSVMLVFIGICTVFYADMESQWGSVVDL